MNSAGWRIWVFGGGTALPSAERDNTFLALEVGADCWLVDCASAPYRRLLQAGLNPLRLQGIVLTHAHADHIYGLPVLLFQLALAGYEGCLAIHGLGETLDLTRRIVEAFSLGELCATHRWHTVTGAEERLVDIAEENGVRLYVAEVSHSRPALGMRIEGEDGVTAAYSGDTGPCRGVGLLAKGVRWLLHECTVDRAFPGHSTPEDVGKVAVEAGVERVGIVHYDPLYGTSRQDLVERIRRAGFKGEVHILGDMAVVS